MAPQRSLIGTLCFVCLILRKTVAEKTTGKKKKKCKNNRLPLWLCVGLFRTDGLMGAQMGGATNLHNVGARCENDNCIGQKLCDLCCPPQDRTHKLNCWATDVFYFTVKSILTACVLEVSTSYFCKLSIHLGLAFNIFVMWQIMLESPPLKMGFSLCT